MNYGDQSGVVYAYSVEVRTTFPCLLQASEGNGGCIQCRLVKVRVEYSLKSTAESVGEPIQLAEMHRDAKFEKLAVPAIGGGK